MRCLCKFVPEPVANAIFHAQLMFRRAAWASGPQVPVLQIAGRSGVAVAVLRVRLHRRVVEEVADDAGGGALIGPLGLGSSDPAI